jgi:hypothetical protein
LEPAFDYYFTLVGGTVEFTLVQADVSVIICQIFQAIWRPVINGFTARPVDLCFQEVQELRFIAFYVGMIIIVLAGLIAVMRLGEGLAAPAAIHGEWRIIRQPEGDCRYPAGWNDPELLMIIQSGRYLELRIGGSSGLSQAGRLIGEQVRTSGAAELVLRLDRQSEPDRLEGELRPPGCEASLYVRFERQHAYETGIDDVQ